MMILRLIGKIAALPVIFILSFFIFIEQIVWVPLIVTKYLLGAFLLFLVIFVIHEDVYVGAATFGILMVIEFIIASSIEAIVDGAYNLKNRLKRYAFR